MGTALGLALLRLICSFYQDYYYLPYIAYHANPIRLAVLPLLVALVGIVSCMLSLRYITGVDPAIAYGGATRRNSTRLPGWLERAHLKTYAKVTICFMYRNLRRIALSALCIASCLVLLIMVLSFDISKNEAISHTFDERLHYDLLVRVEDEQALDDLLTLDGIDETEKAFVFVSDVMGERLQINAIAADAELVQLHDMDGDSCPVPQDGMLVEEGFATRHAIKPGDTIDVDGHEVIVRDIARQYVYCMGYVSFEQAKALGHEQPNALFVRLRSDADKQSFLRDAADVAGYQYAVDTHNQQHDMQEAMLILDYPSLIFVMFAVFIGLVIICNMVIISVSERQTEYATLLVLGVEGPRFLRMVLAETLCYYALACIVGCPLGVVTSDFVLAHIGSATQDFPLVHAPFVVAIACLITLCYMILGVCYAMRAIGRIRPESILNSR